MREENSLRTREQKKEFTLWVNVRELLHKQVVSVQIDSCLLLI